MSEEEGQAPEELAAIWDQEIKDEFAALREKQQLFLLAYIRCGNGAQAYRDVYNPLAGDRLASSCGSQVLASNGMKVIMRRLADTRAQDLLLIKATLTEAVEKAVKPIYAKDKDGQPEKVEDIPDYDIRVKAADKLAKINRLYAEDQALDPSDPANANRPINIIKINGASLEIA
jgi:hypothetical protein